MSFTAAIDISTFIWCEEDFKANKNQYIALKSLAPSVYTQIRELNLSILLRDELYNSIINEFPYNMVKEIGYEFQKLTLEFLTDTFPNWMLYEENNNKSIETTPQITKQHFSNNIQVESHSQKNHLYKNHQNPDHKYIAYNYFFNSTNNLVLISGENNIEVETLRFSTEEEINHFFDQYKIKFRHNPKHDRYKSGGKISPLSCYNERTGDTSKAQELLEKAYKVENDYYYLDEENNVYVQFVSSNDGTYHGFDISDEKDNVPSKIKAKFNRNGRVFS